jgi:hypothetical protein
VKSTRTCVTWRDLAWGDERVAEHQIGDRAMPLPEAQHRVVAMSAEDLERYETEIELQLYQEYRAVLAMFKYVVETERRFYLANEVRMEAKGDGSRTYFEISLRDAWVWDMYRPARFVSSVRVVTFKDVNVEELPEKEL